MHGATQPHPKDFVGCAGGAPCHSVVSVALW
jgi:hypothetical protein